MLNIEFPVYVNCMTYNHAHFIEDTMNGFCMQETCFPFLCVIVDDASQDGEAGVIRDFFNSHFDVIDNDGQNPNETEHYEMLLGRHQKNNNCYFSIFLLKYNHYQKKAKEPYFQDLIRNCKYVANCEGDDYWTDPRKLQKQYNILEDNKKCMLVHSAFRYVDETGKFIKAPNDTMYVNIPKMKKEGYLWHSHIVIGTPILFCTTMCRIAALEKDQLTVDYDWFMTCARKGLISYIDAKTSAYRINSQSLMRTQHDAVNTRIKNAIFYQLYVFANREYVTDRFYLWNFVSRIRVSEAIISSVLIWHRISVPGKFYKLIYILFARPLNALLLPVALIAKIKRRFECSISKL